MSDEERQRQRREEDDAATDPRSVVVYRSMTFAILGCRVEKDDCGERYRVDGVEVSLAVFDRVLAMRQWLKTKTAGVIVGDDW